MEDGSSMSFILQSNNKVPSSTEVLETLWNPNPSDPSNFLGDSYSCSTSMGTSEDLIVEGHTNMHIFQHVEKEENGINDSEDYFYQPEKKRRLRSDQVRCLERSFEVENKLEPERKVHLAKELGLQPRQVAIWFQNRRARFKTKQLEKDYDGLKASYDRLKGDYDSLLKEKERLENEVHILSENVILNEKERTNSESTQRNKTSAAVFQTPISEIKSRNLLIMGKHEDASTANSGVLDSEQSDGENELFAKSLFPRQLLFPKLEDTCFNDSADDGYDATWNFSTDCQASWLWPS